MKSYLDLIPISAKVHSRASRLTRCCIVLAVFLVTVIFSMAEMEIRSQIRMAVLSDGAWHAVYSNIDNQHASMIAARPETENTSWYGVENYDLSKEYTISGTQTVVCGFEEAFLKLMPSSKIAQGSFPSDEKGAAVTQSVKERLGLEIGDEIILHTPEGVDLSFRITGFTADASMLTTKDAFGIFLNLEGYKTLPAVSDDDWSQFVYYAEFSSKSQVKNVIADITSNLGLSGEQVGTNAKLLGLMGQSDDNYFNQLYIVAAVLSVLVITAGVLMMTSSLNSNIAQRTQFFGLMSCQGATGKQIKRFVRAEALSWCRKAIPLGVILGMVMVMFLCAMLKALSPGFFGGMPVFGISWPGVLLGCGVGFLTVFIAAGSPARKAAKVSPLTAVNGNAGTVNAIKKAASTRFINIEASLGIHHAMGSKKNLILMMCSFGFSIILFLAFTTAVDFMNHALKPVKPYAPDITILSGNTDVPISNELVQNMSGQNDVKKTYGRMISLNIQASVNGQPITVNLVSYEKNQFEWAKKVLLEGNIKDTEDSGQFLLVHSSETIANAGDTISILSEEGTKEALISGILSDSIFSPVSGVETVICSENTFRQLTGRSSYDVLDIQLTSKAADSQAAALRSITGPDMVFKDLRMQKSEAKGAYYSFALFIYGFLIIIGMIAAFNIINSIAMSVTARLLQYGAMRAIGMSTGQITKMISSECAVYAITGIAAGCAAGLPINRFLYESLVTFKWGTEWSIPGTALSIILLTVAASSVLAVYNPARRIRNMTIVDTISA